MHNGAPIADVLADLNQFLGVFLPRTNADSALRKCQTYGSRAVVAAIHGDVWYAADSARIAAHYAFRAVRALRG